jgi:hypothetical protein
MSHGLAKDPSEVHKYGSVVHFIAAAKLFNINILVFSEKYGWTLYCPAIEQVPSSNYIQDPELPTFTLDYINDNHFEMDICTGKNIRMVNELTGFVFTRKEELMETKVRNAVDVL